MKKLLIALAALALLLAFAWGLAARLPAGYLLDWTLADQPDVAWSHAGGTVWDGQARMVWAGYDLGLLQWQSRQSDILFGRFQADWAIGGAEIDGAGKVHSEIFGHQIALESLRLRAPAGWLQHILSAPFLILDGKLQATVERLVVRDGWMSEFDGSVDWNEAAVTGRIRTELGGVNVRFETRQAGVIDGIVNDHGGSLSALGVVAIREQTYEVDVKLAARGEAVELRQALEVLGRIDAAGDVHLRITGPMLKLW